MGRLPAPVIQMSQRSMRVNKRYSEILPPLSSMWTWWLMDGKRKGQTCSEAQRETECFSCFSVFCANLKSWHQDKLRLSHQCRGNRCPKICLVRTVILLRNTYCASIIIHTYSAIGPEPLDTVSKSRTSKCQSDPNLTPHYLLSFQYFDSLNSVYKYVHRQNIQ